MTRNIFFLQETLNFEAASDEYEEIREHIDGYYTKGKGCR